MPYTITIDDSSKQALLFVEYAKSLDFARVTKSSIFSNKELTAKEKAFKEMITERVKEAMEIVGLDYEAKKDKSPFEISGGQKRRVAIAGILAMKPDILILDEPTAGLDPKGRDELFFQIKRLYEKNNITIVLISHSMEDVAKLVNRIIIMKNGHIHLDKSTKEAFSDVDDLKKVGLNVPQITELMDILRKKGHHFSKNILTVDEAFSEIKRELRKN